METGAATGAEASADVLSSFLPAGTPPGFVGTNRQEWDGNGTSAPMLHLRDVPLEIPANDHVDALEGVGGVNLSRVVCRAAVLPVDSLTLTSGPDRYQRVRFILARSFGQIDYGISSAGNIRVPSFGGCP